MSPVLWLFIIMDWSDENYIAIIFSSCGIFLAYPHHCRPPPPPPTTRAKSDTLSYLRLGN